MTRIQKFKTVHFLGKTTVKNIKLIGIFLAIFPALAFGIPATFTDLGTIGPAGIYGFDTEGSLNITGGFDLDTELGLWAEDGTLLASDDDGLGLGLYSLINADLTDGVYFLGISEFNSIFGDGFVNTGTAFEDDEIGEVFLNINGIFAGSALAGGAGTGLDQTAFFRVVVGDVVQPMPEPSIMLLLGIGLLGFAGLRRR